MLDEHGKRSVWIAEESELSALGLTGQPEPIESLDGYTIYRGGTDKRIRECFNL
ncbi:MAG: hypothetical protein O3A46_14965 [Candidatus Poribacteria bacterium]|nr:hypothetical protein [Candidatus Poribacteria bacterium]